MMDFLLIRGQAPAWRAGAFPPDGIVMKRAWMLATRKRCSTTFVQWNDGAFFPHFHEIANDVYSADHSVSE
jgi:hypothetical protein